MYNSVKIFMNWKNRGNFILTKIVNFKFKLIKFKFSLYAFNLNKIKTQAEVQVQVSLFPGERWFDPGVCCQPSIFQGPIRLISCDQSLTATATVVVPRFRRDCCQIIWDGTSLVRAIVWRLTSACGGGSGGRFSPIRIDAAQLN